MGHFDGNSAGRASRVPVKAFDTDTQPGAGQSHAFWGIDHRQFPVSRKRITKACRIGTRSLVEKTCSCPPRTALSKRGSKRSHSHGVSALGRLGGLARLGLVALGIPRLESATEILPRISALSWSPFPLALAQTFFWSSNTIFSPFVPTCHPTSGNYLLSARVIHFSYPLRVILHNLQPLCWLFRASEDPRRVLITSSIRLA
jgi:hypothetical protein